MVSTEEFEEFEEVGGFEWFEWCEWCGEFGEFEESEGPEELKGPKGLAENDAAMVRNFFRSAIERPAQPEPRCGGPVVSGPAAAGKEKDLARRHAGYSNGKRTPQIT
ncbi:hypothetical protein [Streptomyces aurantiacus]|uniref:hypothetical protein n=1 Tax=Streptomyces aurantiacus TaxID=47760 RepID=UPI0006E403E6|nr:hypothetical protein [Streptomyces aurantiacus]